MNNFGKFALLGAVLAAAASSAFATPITAGQTLLPIATTTTSSYTSGTLVGSASGTFVPSPGFTLDYNASFTESVYRGGTGATCPTCLAFAYTVTDHSGNSLTSNTISSFDGGITNNIFSISGNPMFATDAGSPITFYYNPTLAAGSSLTFVDFTSATAFGPGIINSANGVAGNAPALSPTAATPEPNSLILLGTGLVGAAGMLFRRRQTA